jgi:hypothetical protein
LFVIRAVSGVAEMPNEKLRRRLAFDAARLIYTRQESDPYRAVLRAARKAFRGWLKPSEFPSATEIRLHLQKMSWITDGDARFDNLRDVRRKALELMRSLSQFSPRLVGSAVSGDVRRLRQIDLRLFTDDPVSVAAVLDAFDPATLHDELAVIRGGQSLSLPVWRLFKPLPTRIIAWPARDARRAIRRRATGIKADQATLPQLEALIRREYPEFDDSSPDDEIDRFQVYRMLLSPLASVEQSRRMHPEGDALYHSLQVFELARRELPYDEEFLLAALLHDIGKALDPQNHVVVGLAALNGHITERTGWLIANHTDAHRLLGGTIGQRARRRLQHDENYDELLLLARCDREGRVPGGEAPELDEALDYIRGIARMCDG